jgi:hypothetical protein
MIRWATVWIGAHVGDREILDADADRVVEPYDTPRRSSVSAISAAVDDFPVPWTPVINTPSTSPVAVTRGAYDRVTPPPGTSGASVR